MGCGGRAAGPMGRRGRGERRAGLRRGAAPAGGRWWRREARWDPGGLPSSVRASGVCLVLAMRLQEEEEAGDDSRRALPQ